METTRSLARVGGVTDGAVFPVLVIHKRALEVEGMVDIGEAELDVEALQTILAGSITLSSYTYTSTSLAPLDAVHFSLHLTFAIRKPKKRHVLPVLVGVVGSYTA